MTQKELITLANRELTLYMHDDVTHASGYFEMIGDVKINEAGKETDD